MASMDRHVRAKRGHLLWKRRSRLAAQFLNPVRQSFSRRSVEPLPLLRFELLGLRQRRESGRMQDFIRVGIANSTDYPGISKRPFQGVILGSQRFSEAFQIAAKNIDAARVHRSQRCFALDHGKRSPALASSFCKYK